MACSGLDLGWKPVFGKDHALKVQEASIALGQRPRTGCHPAARDYSARTFVARSFRARPFAEGWPSGLRRTLGKRVYGKPYRGFESHSLRRIILKSLVFSAIFGLNARSNLDNHPEIGNTRRPEDRGGRHPDLQPQLERRVSDSPTGAAQGFLGLG